MRRNPNYNIKNPLEYFNKVKKIFTEKCPGKTLYLGDFSSRYHIFLNYVGRTTEDLHIKEAIDSIPRRPLGSRGTNRLEVGEIEKLVSKVEEIEIIEEEPIETKVKKPLEETSLKKAQLLELRVIPSEPVWKSKEPERKIVFDPKDPFLEYDLLNNEKIAETGKVLMFTELRRSYQQELIREAVENQKLCRGYIPGFKEVFER